jgi:hypothetical protein
LSVEDHVRPVLREDGTQTLAVADVGDDQLARVQQGPALDRQLHTVQR